MATWPTHPDGRPKKMGEMTRDEQAALVAPHPDLICGGVYETGLSLACLHREDV